MATNQENEEARQDKLRKKEHDQICRQAETPEERDARHITLSTVNYSLAFCID